MLQNRIYLGEIVHKDRHYPGQHQAILDQALWDQAQAHLLANAGDRRAGRAAKQPSLLAGLIFDGLGHRMSPTHAVKAGKRYRYYISRPLVTEGRAKAPTACRIPAAEVEQVVTDRVRALLSDGTVVLDAVSASPATAEQYSELVTQAADLARSWTELAPHEQRRIVTTLITRVEVGDESVALHVVPARLVAILQCDATGDGHSASDEGCDAETVILSVPAQLQRVGKGGRLVVRGRKCALPSRMPRSSGCWHARISCSISCCKMANQHRRTLATHANLNRTYTTLLLRLSWLAPDITQAILRGHQPPTLTADELCPHHADCRSTGRRKEQRSASTERPQENPEVSLAPDPSAMTGPSHSNAADVPARCWRLSSTNESATKPNRDKAANVTDVRRGNRLSAQPSAAAP